MRLVGLRSLTVPYVRFILGINFESMKSATRTPTIEEFAKFLSHGYLNTVQHHTATNKWSHASWAGFGATLVEVMVKSYKILERV